MKRVDEKDSDDTLLVTSLLEDAAPLSMKELSRFTGVPPEQVRIIVGGLENEGHVKLTKNGVDFI